MNIVIELGRADESLGRELLHSPGGFAWWYADLLDDRGDGLVLIWGFGLPFLPGYASAVRQGRAPAAGSRPFLNLAVYKGGKLDGYWLTEFGEGEADWGGGERSRMGNSELCSVYEQGHRRLRVRLDHPVPGSRDRLTGTIDLVGPAVRHTQAVPEGMNHLWTPLTTGHRGRAELFIGGRPYLDVEGRAYHDRNGSVAPLTELGIAHWIWGRVPMPDCERIYYLLWPEDGDEPRAIGVEVGADGTTQVREGLGIELGDRRRALYGMDWWPRVTLRDGDRIWLEARHEELVDNGPFYLRWLVRAEGAVAPGVAEAVRPSRVDLSLHRPLVRMRVHHTQAGNSAFLPLFSGPTQGRLTRFLTQWSARG